MAKKDDTIKLLEALNNMRVSLSFPLDQFSRDSLVSDGQNLIIDDSIRITNDAIYILKSNLETDKIIKLCKSFSKAFHS